MQIVLKQAHSYKHMNKKQTSHSTNRHVYTISTYKHTKTCISARLLQGYVLQSLPV